MIKLIVSDIDGTLVNDGQSNIDPEMFELIKRCKRNGIMFVGASGRQYASMSRLLEPVKDDILFISNNGGIVRDSKKLIYSYPIDRPTLNELITDIKKLPDCDFMLAAASTDYCETDGKMYQWMLNSYHYDLCVCPDVINNLKDDIVKVSIYHKYDDCERVVNEWFREKWEKTFRIVPAGLMWVDIINPTVDKGAAVKEIQKIYGIKKEETMAFGDNINDIGMLDAAGESYAIGSAREEVKKAAKYIAPPLSEYGETTVIRDYLDKHGLM